jgi:uncharacterized membrane protein YtjA (UPF0391 family)
MLGWAIGFFVAALVAAVFGFSGVATTFAGVAIILFWVFLALFVLSILFNTFGGGHAKVGGGGAFATVALIAGVGLLVYAWVDNHMSAERVGRAIDRHAQQLADNTSQALNDAGERAQRLTHTASNQVRDATGAPNQNAAPDDDQNARDNRSN